MPWKTIAPMEEIARFVISGRADRFTIAVLCEQFGIGRIALKGGGPDGIGGGNGRSARHARRSDGADGTSAGIGYWLLGIGRK
jgi:hypothetical protein